MSSQRSMTLANPNGGTMATTSSRCRKRTSRQRLRRGHQLVAPGGKKLGGVEQVFQQQGHQELAVQPGTATVRFPLRQFIQSDNRFHPLEHKFNLPATAIPVQHRRRVQDRRRHVGPDEEVSRQEQRRPRQLLLFLGRPFLQRPPLQTGRQAVSFDRHQPPWVATLAVANDGRPLPNLSHSRRTQFIHQPEPFSGAVVKRQGPMVNPHQDVSPGFGDVGDPRRCAVATVTQHQIAGSHRDTPEGLALGDVWK
jgi:hypothetical protein